MILALDTHRERDELAFTLDGEGRDCLLRMLVRARRERDHEFDMPDVEPGRSRRSGYDQCEFINIFPCMPEDRCTISRGYGKDGISSVELALTATSLDAFIRMLEHMGGGEDTLAIRPAAGSPFTLRLAAAE